MYKMDKNKNKNIKDNINPFSVETSQEKTKIKKILKSNKNKQIKKDDIGQYSKIKTKSKKQRKAI